MRVFHIETFFTSENNVGICFRCTVPEGLLIIWLLSIDHSLLNTKLINIPKFIVLDDFNLYDLFLACRAKFLANVIIIFSWIDLSH